MDCSFCGKEIPAGTGMVFVRTTGKILNFCSKKCEKNLLKLGRISRNVRWTAEHRKEQQRKGGKK